ncbi:hypothetical protein ACSCB1_35255 [Streptomyces europaeiscabiei]|uniref:hypothetical protein n=1 Tax=Streptomyces europaeiscabiei TaxID=146819 RepID=UPI000A4AFB34|nr:hypothetical protein [Streptomyces europaeiscabiei]
MTITTQLNIGHPIFAEADGGLSLGKVTHIIVNVNPEGTALVQYLAQINDSVEVELKGVKRTIVDNRSLLIKEDRAVQILKLYKQFRQAGEPDPSARLSAQRELRKQESKK